MTDEVITHLAMAGPDRLRPAAEVPGVVLELVHSSSPEIRSTQVRVGAPHGWSSTAGLAAHVQQGPPERDGELPGRGLRAVPRGNHAGGTVIVNVVPAPGADSTAIRPPMARTSESAIARPNPAPPPRSVAR